MEGHPREECGNCNRSPAADLERGDCVWTGVSRHRKQKRVRAGQNTKPRVCRNVIKKNPLTL